MRRLLPAAAAALSAAALATVCWLGVYVRYLGDDFCTAAEVASRGFWGSQAYWYGAWSGRYAFLFAVACADAIGPRLVPLLPSLLIVVWCAVAVRSLRSMAGIAVVYAIIDGAPALFQSVLWQTGIVTYAAPLVLLTDWCGAWLRREDGRVRAIDVVVPLLAGGFSETAALCNIVFFALGALFATRRRPFVAATVAAVVALAIVAVAPGNLVRHATRAPGPSLSRAAEATLTDLGTEIGRSGAQLLLVFGLAALLATRRPARRAVAFALLTVLVSTAATELASFVAVGWPLPHRALIVLHFFAVVAAAICGAAVGPRLISVVLLVIALAAPVVAVVQNVHELPVAQADARELDRIDAQLRRGATAVHAPSGLHGIAYITPNAEAWPNRCTAAYYRLPFVRSGGP